MFFFPLSFLCEASHNKDSTVLLDLARRVSPEIRAAYVDTGLEYPEIRQFVKTVPNVTWLRPELPFHKVLAQYGYPVISKEVARRIDYARKGRLWAIMQLQGMNRDGSSSVFAKRYQRWAYLVNAPFAISDQCCLVMKERPLDRFTKDSGLQPIIGTMACESMRRQQAYLTNGCNAFHKKKPTSQPMSFWLEQDVLRYLQMTGIPYASGIYGDIVEESGVLRTTKANRTGCMFCMFGVHLEKEPNRFQRMALTHPRHYDLCIHRLGCGKVLDYIGVPYGPIGGEIHIPK